MLVESPAGVGKTELAKAVAQVGGTRLVRLQCYEGVDETRALYEWNHSKQLLRITAGRDETWGEALTDIFSEEFRLACPLLTAIQCGRTDGAADRRDRQSPRRAGQAAAGVLSDFQITVPELGTITAYARRRSAELRGTEHIAEHAVAPSADQIDFLNAGRAAAGPQARHRLAARRRQAARGQIDLCRTLHRALSTGGVPLHPVYQHRRPARPEIALLCDVCGSVADFANFTMLLVQALHDQFSKVRVFAFGNRTDEVTRLIIGGLADPVELGRRILIEATVTGWHDSSDYGAAMGEFAERHLDAVGPRTSVLILGDARTNG